MKKSTIATTIIIALVLILTANTVFIVEEGHQAITIRLGRIVNTYENAGVNVKVPFFDNVHIFPKKILTWNNKPTDIITNDKEYLQVNVTVRWRITDPVKFYEANRNIQGSYAKLDTILDPAIKLAIAAHNRVEVVRSSNDMLNDGYKTSESKPIETGRDQISNSIKASAMSSFEEQGVEQGIEIMEVIFKQVRFSDNLTQSVYERMIKSRKVIAEGHRSEGQGKKEQIIGETDKDLLEIRSEAFAYEQQKKGEADAEAARIYAEAYDVDPEFYAFWRALESYKETMPQFKKTLSTDMEYFQYLYSSN